MNEVASRFSGIVRLYGTDGVEKLRSARVAVVGIGGVGSWAAEALARSGVGALTLVDLDDVCVTNINRQLQALEPTIGRPKVEAMAERVRQINPDCHVSPVSEFFTEATENRIFAHHFDWVVDAIDSVANKCRLIAACCERRIPVISCGAAGGRCDTTAVRIADLAEAHHDRLLAEVRTRLRRSGIVPPAGKLCEIPCVFSPETPVAPKTCNDPEAPEVGARLNCDFGYGSAVFVTGAFGFAAAGWAVQKIATV